MKLLFFQRPDGSAACGPIPGGLGAKRNPPLWMRAGGVAEVEISGVGTLRNKVEDEA